MRTSNPALKPELFSQTGTGIFGQTNRDVMTIDGAVQKTGILAFLLIISAGFIWSRAFQATGYEGVPAMLANPGMLTPWMMGGMIGGLILAIVTSFKPQWAMYTAPAYAVVEGLFIGAISSFMELRFPGIVMQASLLTMGTLVTMLMAYKAGVLKATEKFRSVVMMATGAIFVTYLISMILGFFGVSMSFLHDSSPLSIGISLVVVVVAALNLILDFDLIEQGAAQNSPKYMEWYSGFALMVTLVWLYIEFLRLLSKLNSRD